MNVLILYFSGTSNTFYIAEYIANHLESGKCLVELRSIERFPPQKENMTPEELFEAYMGFRKRLYSMYSIARRLFVSKVNIFHNLVINIGYKMSLSHYL